MLHLQTGNILTEMIAGGRSLTTKDGRQAVNLHGEVVALDLLYRDIRVNHVHA